MTRCNHLQSRIFLSKVMPYKWMPRFVNATDSSARTLKLYNSVSNNSVAPRSDILEAVASRKCNYCKSRGITYYI